MSLPTLSWINAEFLQVVLRKSENDESIEVADVSMSSGTAVGDNYMSDLMRANIEYSRDKSDERITEKKSLIIKVAPTLDENNKRMIAELGFFEKEIQMKSTLTEMNNLLKDKRHRLSPDILHTDLSEPAILVIEDLTPLGYRMGDCRVGLNLEHCILSMRLIARFHGCSVALWEKDPQSMDSYRDSVFSEKTPTAVRMIFENGIRTAAKEILTWSELGSSRYISSEKLLKLADTFLERAGEIYRIKDDAFNVLNHGDAWTNNMLYRYNENGKVSDIIFVDFQVSSWGSPAVDLAFFLSTSLSEDVDLHHRKALLQEYLKTLTETMSDLSCNTKPPSMAELEKMLKDFEILDLIRSTAELPYMLLDKNESLTIVEIMSLGDDSVNPAFANKVYRKRLSHKLNTWNASGVFDSL